MKEKKYHEKKKKLVIMNEVSSVIWNLEKYNLFQQFL